MTIMAIKEQRGPNIRSDFDRWGKECEGCIVAKAVQPSVWTTVGHHLS